ncbi:MAG: TIGR01459 family HAD-type hydrolase [Caulobacterales bacterium]
MQHITRLEEISGRYDALLCDIWGVIHNGRAAYLPACDALAEYRTRGGKVVLVSNVPKQRDPIPGQLARLGVRSDAWDAIVTSGDAIRAELKARAPGPFYKIGPDMDEILWSGLGLARSNFNDATFFAISGLNDDTKETPEDYAELLAEARARDLDLLCANPDIVVQRGDQLVWCAGAIARDYEAIGGRVIMAGKPFAPIYDLAYAEITTLLGKPADKTRLLAIGDGVGTDLKGANAQGLDVLFVASGMHGETLKTNGGLDVQKVAAALTKDGAHATHVMEALK